MSDPAKTADIIATLTKFIAVASNAGHGISTLCRQRTSRKGSGHESFSVFRLRG